VSESYEFTLGPNFDILLTGRRWAVWEKRGRMSKKFNGKAKLKPSDIPISGGLKL